MTDLKQWISALEAELELPAGTVDMKAVLDLARDAAHAVERPAAPLTAYAVGYAEGIAAARAGGPATPDDETPLARAARLAERWPGASAEPPVA